MTDCQSMFINRDTRTCVISGGIGAVLILFVIFGIDTVSETLVNNRLRDIDGSASVEGVLFAPSVLILDGVSLPGSGLLIDTLIIYWDGDILTPVIDSVLLYGGLLHFDRSDPAGDGNGDNRDFPPGRFSNILISHGRYDTSLVSGVYSGTRPGDSLACLLEGGWGRGSLRVLFGSMTDSICITWFKCHRLPEEIAILPEILQGFDLEGRMTATRGDHFSANGIISRVDCDPSEILFHFSDQGGEPDVRLSADLSRLREVLISQAESILGDMYVDFIPTGTVELEFRNCDTVGVMIDAQLDSVKLYSNDILADTVRTSASLNFRGYTCLSTWEAGVDSGSVSFGDALVYFSLNGSFDRSRRLELRLWNGNITGDAITRSIPAELLGRLQGLKLGGAASFDIGIVLDWQYPDSSDFTAVVDVSNLLVLSSPIPVGHLRWGGSVRMRDSWGYSRWVHLDTLENPDFMIFDSLHPSFEGILRCAEDATFRSHSGFCIYHIRNSIIANLKAGTFARGGSTITMQLARNLFLGKEKTFARKFQEVFLTWRLESYLNKNRILEIYANIVELGPGIFGFDEAADYYFGRRFRDLSTREVAYLISILPGPAMYHRFFANNSVPIYWEEYLDRLITISDSRGWIHGDSARSAVGDSIVFSGYSEPPER